MSSLICYVARRWVGILFAVALLSGCASTSSNPQDPFEPFNRGVYKFNENLDKAVLRPTARVYRAVLPSFVRQSVGNVFSNVGDVRAVLNNTLQGKFTTAYSDFGRVVINSTLGMFGLFDIATEAGIERHQEDFGQTLGWWGIPDGPFIMLPLFGPSSVRDTGGFVVDWLTDPITYVDPTRTQNQLMATRLVNRRAELLGAKQALDAAALDGYQFMRDGYLQRRHNLVFDGNPPRDKDTLDAPPKPDGSPAKRPAGAASPETRKTK